jgi:hypothetical protein
MCSGANFFFCCALSRTVCTARANVRVLTARQLSFRSLKLLVTHFKGLPGLPFQQARIRALRLLWHATDAARIRANGLHSLQMAA